MMRLVHSVEITSTQRSRRGAVPALPALLALLHDPGMQRPSVYPYTNREPPGVNVHRLRHKLGLSQRALADQCSPPLDHTTIRRLEQNLGYTQDTLERVAKALQCTVSDLFLPEELAGVVTLPDDVRKRLTATVADVVAAYKKR